jgi:hypothetical protein
MILMGTREEGERTPQHIPLDEGYAKKNTYFASPADQRPSPNAFLVQQSPNSRLSAHFHHASQFQVFVAGGGTIGRHELHPVTVHYAGQQTAYGPLHAGPEGLWYFTLRAVTESGAWIMPDSAALKDRQIPRSHQIASPLPPLTADELARIGEPELTELFSEPNGLGSWQLRIPPHGQLPAPPDFTGSGRFYLVIGGSVSSPQRELPPMSAIWVSEEKHLDFRAGPGGADMVIVQFPTDAWKFEVPPVARISADV